MKKLATIVLLLFAMQVGIAQGSVTAVKCGKLIDGKSDAAIENAVILIEGNKIKEVGKDVSIPTNAKVIDLSNATVMPGLIDAHTHILLQGDITNDDYAVQILKESIPYRALRASLSCKTSLLNGFTTLRDLGTEGGMYADVDLKKAINNGIIVGPRLFVAGRAINSTGHYLLSNREYTWEWKVPKGLIEITGANEARRAVREEISYGADWIKIYVDRSYYQLPDGSYRSLQNFTQEELSALGDETAMHRKKMSAHAVTRDGIIPAIKAGAASVEHGFGIDDDCIKLMIEKGIYWCPTIHVNEFVAEGRAAVGSMMNKTFSRTLPATFNKALKAGVKIAFGTDAGGFDWTENEAKEFSYMVKWGMTPMQAIKSATAVAAELLDMKGKIGEISPGAFADIVASKDDPLKNISVLEHIGFVMKDGKVYKDEASKK
ncbi:MAG: amidohydrolase family protein [Ignavibacteriales bacterium]|nr:amidohydrolase family protein [Ignavibacteriales bacterium]